MDGERSHGRLKRVAAIVAGVLVIAIPAVVIAREPASEDGAEYPIPDGAEVLQAADFEDGEIDDGWAVQAQDGRLYVVDDTAGNGDYSVYCERREGDEEVASGNRAEISAEPISHDDEDELIYAGRFMVDGDSALPGDSWSIIYQWHGEGDSGSPPLALFVSGEDGDSTFGLRMGHGDGSRTDWEGSGFAFDEWHAFTVRVKWSDDEDEGFLELWIDGEWQDIGPAGPNGVPRETYATNTESNGIYLKACVYRGGDHEGTTRHFVDDVKVLAP
jgi:hypothetical protein